MTAHASNRENGEGQLARRLTWLAVATEILRSRRLQGEVTVGVVVLAALVDLGREMQARLRAGARAWDGRQDQRAADAAEKANRHG